MRWSNALIPTLKETPADAVAPSHILLLRAGMIRQLGAGAYTYLPLGLRVLHKASQIVRQEMDAAGAIELLMPALQPIEIWKESGRYETYGDLLMKLTLSGGHQMCLGPTHEEVMTDLVRDLINSYKQLPITMYQIQTKFRDEPRPRFGIVRTREFVMKDAYSFDADVAQLNKSYDAMYEAYCRIYDRCGLPYVIVEAESGPIGGDASHEFMVPCSTGEDRVIQCTACGYAANQERAEIGAHHAMATKPDLTAPPFKAVDTPGKRTIRDVCEFLKVEESTSAKLLVYLGDGKPVAVLLRGDHEANEAKVRRAIGVATLVPADPETIQKATGAPMGFLGPVEHQDPDGHRPGHRGDGDGRGGRERGGRAPERRRARPRLPARSGVRPSQCRCRRSLSPLRRHDGEPGGTGDRPRLQARDQVLQGDGRDLSRREGGRDPDHHGLLWHRHQPDHGGGH